MFKKFAAGLIAGIFCMNIAFAVQSDDACKRRPPSVIKNSCDDCNKKNRPAG